MGFRASTAIMPICQKYIMPHRSVESMYPNNQQKETVSIHLPITDDQAGGDNGGNGSVDALHVAPLPGCTADFRLGSVGSL